MGIIWTILLGFMIGPIAKLTAGHKRIFWLGEERPVGIIIFLSNTVLNV